MRRRFSGEKRVDVHKDFGLIFWLHLLLLAAIWSSPFWVPWRWMLAGIALYYLQLLIVGGCILTKLQFGASKPETTFYAHLLESIGFRCDRRRVSFTVDYVLPWLLIGIALLWQSR